MVGTHPNTAGGISTVVRGYQAGGLFNRVDSRYIHTHVDGGAARKLLVALRAYSSFIGSLLRGRSPLVHVHLSSRASFWRKSGLCLLALAAGRPYLIHMHGSEFMKFYQEESGRFTQRLIAFILKRAALVLALSDQWRNNLLSISPDAVVEVLPNAVPLPDLTLRQDDPAAPCILFLGRLGQRKGTFDLVKAFAKVVQQHPTARLICAGDGAVDEVRSLAASLGLADRVICPGWLDPAKAGDLLRVATVFTLPSYAEGLPMALLEAMSWGLPVVTSPVGGIPQAVRDGENGLLVEPGNVDALATALSSLLADAGRRAQMGGAARATIERSFSLDACITQLVAIYRRFGIENRA
jgi:glycosyltransferase involved in cell wall biosynthesis